MARWLLPAVLATLLMAPSASAASFDGTTWRVMRIAGQPVAPFRLQLEFPNTTAFAGFDGCNRFGGDYRATATRLRFRHLRSTAIGCEGGRLPRLTDRLLRARRYRLAGKRLELRRGGRTLVVLRRR